MKIKYVIIDEAYPVIISGCHKHSDVLGMDRRITSAGYFSVREEEDINPHAIALRKLAVTVWGESQSLGVKSEPSDAAILERLFSTT